MHLSKKCSVFKVVLSALLIVALLQLIYLSFLSKFHGKQQRYRYSELFGAPRQKPCSMRKRTEGAAERQYRIYKNLIKSDFTTNLKPGSPLDNPNILSLATHTTLNNLHHLDSLLERCFFCPKIQEFVDFHLVCLSGEMASFPEQDREHFVGLEDCSSVFKRLETHRDKFKNYAIHGNISYPNNLLRNVARGGIESAYILVIDIDMMPNADLHQQFVAMIMKQELVRSEVFVLPAFEIRHDRKMPATKQELVQLYQVGEVRPFYEELCPRCQAPTNYSQWVNIHVRGSAPLEVSYMLTWVDPWEPFYIGPRTTPLYDENFKQYGFNRISQACELHVAGYRFSVLNSAFVVHRGFKIQGEFHAKKDEENKHNRVLFRSFKEGLKTKYPSSTRRC
uniref:Beta-1,4-glucuronyltransferase 1 n=1 Tax=Neogobius melanostomus TaxID=47308 RepID=A0A8C6UQZ8_9GOBI